MRLAYLSFLVGTIAIANTANAQCGAGYGTGYGCGHGHFAAGGHGYGYGGYNCDFASSLWSGFCQQPSNCCGFGTYGFGGCGLGKGFGCGLGRGCGGCSYGGCGTWWYGYDSSLCCGCGGCGGGGLGCGGCFGGLLGRMRNQCAYSSWCGGGCLDGCGLTEGYGFGCGCEGGGYGCGTSGCGNGAYANGAVVESHGAPSTLEKPTPAQSDTEGDYEVDDYTPQDYTPRESGTFYESEPTLEGSGTRQNLLETLPSGTDDA